MKQFIEIIEDKYLKDLKDELELYDTELYELKNGLGIQLVVTTIKNPPKTINYKKDGHKPQVFKDIPVNQQHVELKVLKQRFCNLNKNENKNKHFTLPLSCMLENHRMTKRLANYSLESLSMNSFRFVSDETGISRRTLQNLLSEWMQRVKPTWEMGCLYVFLLSKKNKVYVMLDSKLNAVKITNNIFEMTNIVNQFKSDKVVIPFDKNLALTLKRNMETDVVIDYFDFKDFIEREVWKCYEKRRNRTLRNNAKRGVEPEIKTNIKEEHDLFFKESYTLSAEEQIRFNQISEENHLYSFYKSIKNKLISKARLSFMKVEETVYPSFSYTTTLFSPGYYDVLSLLPIRDKKISELIDSVDRLLEQGIHFEELYFSKDYRNKYQVEYEQLHKTLTKSQFILRWNYDKKYE